MENIGIAKLQGFQLGFSPDTYDAFKEVVRTGTVAVAAKEEHSQMLFFGRANAPMNVLMVAPLFGNDEGKDLLASMGQKLVDEFGATWVALVCEAWVVVVGKDDPRWRENATRDNCDIRPSEQPDRVEQLMLSFHTTDFAELESYQILRDVKGNRSGLGEKNVVSSHRTDSRFNFFPRVVH